MDRFDKDALRTLLKHTQHPCLSLYMPTFRMGEEVQQNPIRFKNLIREAEVQLRAYELRAPEIRELLDGLEARLLDRDFWEHQSDGLATFHSPDLTRTFRVPLHFDELVMVSDRFHTKPLLPLLSEDGVFYILAISQGAVRLLQGSRDNVDEVTLGEEVPGSLAEALKFDDPEATQQYHEITQTTSRSAQAIYHGHGVGTDDDKSNVVRYFQLVDKGLRPLLAGTEVPLVLAAVDYLHPLYHQANSFPGLLEEGLHGNPEERSAESLHEAAWKIVAPHFARKQRQALDQYRELAGTDQTSSDVQEIVPAAYAGRIDTLFVAAEGHQWGHYDPATNQVEVDGGQENGKREDLLDFAAGMTLLNGGSVYALDQEEIPAESLMAARFRF